MDYNSDGTAWNRNVWWTILPPAIFVLILAYLLLR